MVFDTALCILIFGMTFWLTRRPGAAARRVRTVLAVIPILLCATVLLELLLDRPLGVDLAWLHTWYEYGNRRPGMMAPNTAIGFIAIGVGVLLADRVTSKRRGIGAVLITFFVLGVGLTGLTGYALRQDLLFEWSRSARMSFPAGMSMVLCSLGLRLMWSDSAWYVSHRHFREDEKIRLLGPATLAVVTITAALSGFVLQQHTFQDMLSSKLQSILHERSALLTARAAEPFLTTLSPARLALLTDAGRSLLHERTPSPWALQLLTAEMASPRLRALALENSDGVVLRRFGDPRAAPTIIAPLGNNAELLWDGELLIRARTPLIRDGVGIGSLVMDQSTGSLEKALFDTGDLGKTGEIAACMQRGPQLLCFPGSRHRIPYTITVPATARRLLPIQLALSSGQAGEIVAIDYRGQNVIAAYALLAPGLGMVVKEDAVELYALIRQSLRIAVPLLILLAALGVGVLYFQLRPLTAQMLASEARANERELQMRTVIETVGEGIMTFDADGLIHEVNPALCEIFGYQATELIGKKTHLLTPDKAQDATYGRLHDPERGLGILSGQRNFKLSGRRKDGSEFPLELSIRGSNFAGRPSFVGVARDITERIEAEQRLTALGHYDSLTALPNRSLFLDRLKALSISMEGSGMAIALMFVDVDGFKEINDKLGHRGGGDPLIQFAQRLSRAVRDSDLVARLAGDEFTIILQGLSEPRGESRRVADKIIASLRRPFLLSGREVTVTASLGLVIQESGGFNTADLLGRADAAMYAAKHAGKNQVVAA